MAGMENVNEARRRSPDLEFRVVMREDTGIRPFGKFDLSFVLDFCITSKILSLPSGISRDDGKVAILEGVIVPGMNRSRPSGTNRRQRIRGCAMSLYIHLKAAS